ncbi:hypothetical protein NKH18_38080 [Streptomyces sp. M10(2022)]
MSHEAARAAVFRFIEVEYSRTTLREHPESGHVFHSRYGPCCSKS